MTKRRYTIILAIRRCHAGRGEIPGYEFLMIRTMKRENRLELPGGTLEPGESPLDCARREFIEETGYDWKDPALIHHRPGDQDEGFVYLCKLGRRVGEPERGITGVEYMLTLPRLDRLSFPDDPYEELFAAARAHLATPPAASDRP